MSRSLWLATRFSTGEATGGMPRTLGQIARLDRRWFRAHPERRHRCRWPERSNSIFATVTAADAWSWGSATSDAGSSSISQSFFRARCPETRGRRRCCLRSPQRLRAGSGHRPNGPAAPATRLASADARPKAFASKSQEIVRGVAVNGRST
jgi:hypothetical protein